MDYSSLNLSERFFWFSEECVLGARPSIDQVLEVLKYKLSYESMHGDNVVNEPGEPTFAAEETERFRCDLVSLRGRRMIDVRVGSKIALSVRFRDTQSTTAAELASDFAKEFSEIRSTILAHLSTMKHSPSDAP